VSQCDASWRRICSWIGCRESGGEPRYTWNNGQDLYVIVLDHSSDIAKR
jgi:hypothetical protein